MTRPARSTTLALVPLLAGTFVGTTTNSVVNAPMERVVSGLQVPLQQGALVIVAFNLVLAVLMPLTGWLGDRFGSRRVFCCATAALGLAAAGAALAPTLGVLVAFRALQGAATAAILPIVMGLITQIFPDDRRGQALAMWAAANGAGQAAGPVLGGALATWFGWRAIFLPSVPLSLVAMATGLWLLPRIAPRSVRLDWQGAALLTSAAALGLGAVTAVGQFRLLSPWVWAAGALAVLAAVAFVLVERAPRRGVAPLLSPGHLVEPRYLRSSVTAVAQMFCFGANLLAVPLYLTAQRGMSPLAAGLTVLCLPVAMSLTAPVVGWLTGRWSPRGVLRVGLGLLVAGQALLALAMVVSGGVWTVAAPLLVIGAGMAAVQTPSATGATRSRAGGTGAGIGLFNLLRFGGSALGAAWVAGVIGQGPAFAVVFVGCAAVGAVGFLASFLRGVPQPPGALGSQDSSSLSESETETRVSM